MIQVECSTRSYGEPPAADAVLFHVHHGAAAGLARHASAGKTTPIKSPAGAAAPVQITPAEGAS